MIIVRDDVCEGEGSLGPWLIEEVTLWFAAGLVSVAVGERECKDFAVVVFKGEWALGPPLNSAAAVAIVLV